MTNGIVARSRSNGSTEELLGLIDELAQTMIMTSICGLGQVAANPMTTVIQHFRDELNEHIVNGRCPAGVCDMAG
jgi:NADH:ubiquinone oxidoreductase subunit F (NADH-binding)